MHLSSTNDLRVQCSEVRREPEFRALKPPAVTTGRQTVLQSELIVSWYDRDWAVVQQEPLRDLVNILQKRNPNDAMKRRR